MTRDTDTDGSEISDSQKPDESAEETCAADGPALVPADSETTQPVPREGETGLYDRLRAVVSDVVEWARTEGVPAAKERTQQARDGFRTGVSRARQQARETKAKTDVGDPRVVLNRVPTMFWILALVGLVVVSGAALVGPNTGGPPTSAGSDSTPTPQPSATVDGEVFDPEGVADSDGSGPPGSDSFNELPRSHRDALGSAGGTDVPDPKIKASQGSQTLRSDAIRGSEGGLKLVLADNKQDSGRWVSFSAEWLEKQTGEVPETVKITHESGDVSHSVTHVRDGRVTFFVPHFSTNVITFESTVSVTGVFGEGSQASYIVRDPTQAGKPNVTVTGVRTSEWDNVTVSSVPSGGVVQLQIAGNIDPTGPVSSNPTVTLTGSETVVQEVRNASGDMIISVSGDSSPRNATIVFEGKATQSSTTQSGTGSGTVTVDGNTVPENQTVVIEGSRNLYLESWSGTGDGSFTANGDTAPIDANITFVGRESLIAETRSGTGDGSISVSGDAKPKNVIITFEGGENVNSQSVSFSGGSGVSQSLTVGGNIAPTSESVTVTGVTQTGTQETATGTGSGTVTVGGNIAPVGPSANNEPEVTITGNTQTSNGDQSGTGVVSGNSVSLTNGNVAPTGPSTNNNPTVSLTGVGGTTSTTSVFGKRGLDPGSQGGYFLIGDDGDGTVSGSVQIKPESSGAVSSVDLHYGTDGSDYLDNVSIYIVKEGVDGNYREGKFAGTWNPDWSTSGYTTIQLSNPVYVESGQNYTVEFVNTEGSLNNGNKDMIYVTSNGSPDGSNRHTYSGYLTSNVGALRMDITESPGSVSVSDNDGHTATFGNILPGETVSREIDLSGSSSSLSFSFSGGGSLNWSVTKTDRTATTDPSIDIDGDGTAEASYTGILKSGQSVTREIASLSSGSRTVGTTTTTGPQPDWEITDTPRTATSDPKVDPDGDGTYEVSCSGIYKQGQTCTGLFDVSRGNSTATLSTTAGTAQVTVSWDERTAVENPSVDVDGDNYPDATYSGILKSGETGTVSVSQSSLPTGSVSINVGLKSGPLPAWTLGFDRVEHTTDPSVDIDGDGSVDASFTGTLAPGESARVGLSGIALGGNGPDLSTTSGAVPNWTVRAERVEHSENPSVTVNGTQVSVSQTLGPGETVTKTLGTALGPGNNSVTTTTTTGPQPQWTISFGDISYTERPSVDINGDGAADGIYKGKLVPGETAEVPVANLSRGTTTVDVSVQQGPLPAWSLGYERVEFAQNITVDVSGDGTVEYRHSDPLGPTDSVTTPLNLTTATDSLVINTSGLSVSVDVRLRERLETPSGSVTYPNGSATFGNLSADNSRVVEVPRSALVSGANTVGVNMDSPDPDSPPARVRINLSHTVSDEQTVSYTSEVFTERYEISRTYSSDMTAAKITVPWAGNVVEVRSVRIGINGSTPIRPESSVLSFKDGTHLSVDVVELVETRLNQSTVPEGLTVRVVTNASRIGTHNSSVSVLQPSIVGTTLDSRIKLTEWNPDSYLRVDTTVVGSQLHYATNETYQSESDYTVVGKSGSQKLFLPDATAGSKVTVTTLPVEITPKRESVRVRVPEELVNDTQIAVSVKPDRVVGESVGINYIGGSESVWYGLVRRSDGTVVDRAQGGALRAPSDDNVVLVIDKVGPPPENGPGTGPSLAFSALGSGGKILPLTTVFGLLLGVIGIGRSPESARSLGRSVGSAVGSAVGAVPGLDGETVESALSGALVSVANGVAAVGSTRTRVVGLVVITAVGVYQSGLVSLPTELVAIGGVALVSVSSLVALQAAETFTPERWIAVTAAVTLVGLQATGSTNLLGAVIDSRAFVLIVGVGGYVAVKLVREYAANNGPNDDRPQIVIDRDGGNE